MAPLEDSSGVHRRAELRPIDSLMRALLYVVQQVGRPLSEADVRGLAALADEPLDERGFLTVGARLGLQASAVDLATARLDDLPTPFALAGGALPAHGAPQSVAPMMALLAAAMLGVYALDFSLRVARGWLSARAGARLDTLMSAEVVHHLVQLPYRHFERTPSGVIAERLRQLDVLRGFFTGQMPVLAIDLVFVVLFLGAAFTISMPLGIIAAAAIPVLIAVSLATHRAQRRLADENFQALAAKSSTLGETVANAATIKALGLEAEVEKRWQARAEQAAWTNFRASHLANVAASASGILQLVAVLALVVMGTHEVVDHRLTVGGLIAANMLAGRALQPMRQLATAWHQLPADGP